MHTRRIAAFLLGAWLLGSVLMAVVAFEIFGVIDRVLAAPAPAALIARIGADNARRLLLYYAASCNHIILNYWEWAQVAFGVALGVTLLFARYVSRIAAAASAVMVLLVLFVHFVIAPELAFVDRSLTADPALRRNAGMLGGVYSALELVKFLIGAALSAYLFAFKNGSRRRVRRELDAIDPASLRTD
ncbi:MAG TPA: hypothetical protein VFA28_19920 [Bryobacteraceae bacterium]|jgi:hypothetical protein|nr:hypothetical protein [Bryobacteraceae bacterium]